MANYAIFDEQYYLASYPWVKPAIDAGVIKSGREHFEKFGQAGGLTKVSRYFDEATYLGSNSDIRPFIRTLNNPGAPFATGLDHFIQFRYEEEYRRNTDTPISPEYSERFYLANNSELRSLIGPNGTFKSGYQHFIQFGVKEGRFGTSFFEPEYLKKNPDIVPFVNSGALKTGREHYFNFGRDEPSRSATFVGSRSNDVVAGVVGTRSNDNDVVAGNIELIGVEVGIDPTGNRQLESFGTDEFDVLIGSPGVDTFVLGVPATAGIGASIAPTALYVGNGQATLQNFNAVDDLIQLQGNSLSDGYSLTPVGNSLSIQRFGDVLGVIPGGAGLNLVFQQSNGNGTFAIG